MKNRLYNQIWFVNNRRKMNSNTFLLKSFVCALTMSKHSFMSTKNAINNHIKRKYIFGEEIHQSMQQR